MGTLKCLSSVGTNSIGLAVGVCDFFSISVCIIIGFVTLPENMTVVNAVPAGTDIKLF